MENPWAQFGWVEKRKAAVRDPDSLEVRRPNLASRKSVTMSIIQFCYQKESEINKIVQLVGETSTTPRGYQLNKK